MEITFTLPGNSLMATYLVEREDDITYNIRLKSFSGENKPPIYIKLYRTELGWRSAFEDPQLVNHAGAAIEENIAEKVV